MKTTTSKSAQAFRVYASAISVIVLFVATSLLNVASAQSPLHGNWKLDVEESIATMETADKSRFEALPAESQQRARESMRNRVFDFAADGTVTINWQARSEAKTSTGSWSADTVNKKLTIVIDGAATEYTYETPAENILILLPALDGGYFRVLYFTKD